MKNKKSFRKWLKNLFNKKEVAIVIIDPKIIDELAENLKELDKRLKEFNSKRQFKGVPPIPDYKKVSKTEKHFYDFIGYELNNPEVREKMFEKSKAYWKSYFETFEKSQHFRHKSDILRKEIFEETLKSAEAIINDFKEFENKDPKIDCLNGNYPNMSLGQIMQKLVDIRKIPVRVRFKCKHQKVTTTQYFEPISVKVIFTSKVCNDCNADLLK